MKNKNQISKLKKINLLIIDDDELFQFVASALIGQTNLVGKLKIISNGSEALNFLKTNTLKPEEIPDVIFLDIEMPVIDGWKFIEEFAKLLPGFDKKIRLFLLTVSIDPKDFEHAKSIPIVSGFIVKPLSKETIIKTLKI